MITNPNSFVKAKSILVLLVVVDIHRGIENCKTPDFSKLAYIFGTCEIHNYPTTKALCGLLKIFLWLIGKAEAWVSFFRLRTPKLPTPGNSITRSELKLIHGHPTFERLDDCATREAYDRAFHYKVHQVFDRLLPFVYPVFCNQDYKLKALS